MSDVHETLADDLRSEASIADRPGQYDRLNSLAERVDRYVSAVEKVLALCDEADSRNPKFFGFLVTLNVRKAIQEALGGETNG